MNQRMFPTWIAIASGLIAVMGLTTTTTSQLAISAPSPTTKSTSRSPFYSQAGRFSINFPSEPVTSSEKSENGTITYYFRADSDQSSYQLSYLDSSDLPSLARAQTSKLLIDLTTAFIQGAEAKLLNAKSIQIGQNLGREFNFSIQGATGRGRIYIVGERVYVMVCADSSSSAIVAFLNSFRLR
jgi:hypothetical protein